MMLSPGQKWRFPTAQRTRETGRRGSESPCGRTRNAQLLTNFDRAALAAYCGAYALWAEATQAIQKFGVMIKSPSGYPVQSPYVSVANRQAEIMMRIASEFGFTPASRSRISTHSNMEPTLFDRLADYPDEAAS